MLERLFKIREQNSTVGIEVIAGLTTFLTMVYILVVNPSIVSATGMPQGALFTATTLAVIIATLLMAFYANMPFALAPGMGINAFFTFVIVLGKGYTWNEALTAVLFAGILFSSSAFWASAKCWSTVFPTASRMRSASPSA